MWEAWGGVEPSISSWVGLFDVFVPGVAGHIMGVVSITTMVLLTGTSVVVWGIHVYCGTNSSFGGEDEVVGSSQCHGELICPSGEVE